MYFRTESTKHFMSCTENFSKVLKNFSAKNFSCAISVDLFFKFSTYKLFSKIIFSFDWSSNFLILWALKWPLQILYDNWYMSKFSPIDHSERNRQISLEFFSLLQIHRKWLVFDPIHLFIYSPSMDVCSLFSTI